MQPSFSDLVDCLSRATQPEQVFGDLSGDRHVALKRRYRELAAIVHPDHNRDRVADAAMAFRALQTWHTLARRRLEQGAYGKLEYIAAVTELHDYSGDEPPLHGDLCELFPCSVATGRVLLKVARSSRNNDLLKAEARSLRRLERELAGERIRAHFPTLIEQFRLRDTDGATRQVNVLRAEDDYVTLADILRAYPRGVDAADAAWMFNRVLAALGVVHDLGIVHGAVTPAHVLIRPADHNGMLIDWCYSGLAGARLKAMSPPYAADYPPEIQAREPVTPATDVYMAARCMLRLLGGSTASSSLPPAIPKPIGALLRACLLPSPLRRANNAWQIFEDFQEILERLYGSPTFRPFALPDALPPVAH